MRVSCSGFGFSRRPTMLWDHVGAQSIGCFDHVAYCGSARSPRADGALGSVGKFEAVGDEPVESGVGIGPARSLSRCCWVWVVNQ